MAWTGKNNDASAQFCTGNHRLSVLRAGDICGGAHGVFAVFSAQQSVGSKRAYLLFANHFDDRYTGTDAPERQFRLSARLRPAARINAAARRYIHRFIFIDATTDLAIFRRLHRVIAYWHDPHFSAAALWFPSVIARQKIN